MEWVHVLTIVAANVGVILPLFLWIRSEANADRRELASIVMDMRRDFQEEMKDFHGRLCAIEEARKR